MSWATSVLGVCKLLARSRGSFRTPCSRLIGARASRQAIISRPQKWGCKLIKAQNQLRPRASSRAVARRLCSSRTRRAAGAYCARVRARASACAASSSNPPNSARRRRTPVAPKPADLLSAAVGVRAPLSSPAATINHHSARLPAALRPPHAPPAQAAHKVDLARPEFGTRPLDRPSGRRYARV